MLFIPTTWRRNAITVYMIQIMTQRMYRKLKVQNVTVINHFWIAQFQQPGLSVSILDMLCSQASIPSLGVMWKGPEGIKKIPLLKIWHFCPARTCFGAFKLSQCAVLYTRLYGQCNASCGKISRHLNAKFTTRIFAQLGLWTIPLFNLIVVQIVNKRGEWQLMLDEAAAERSWSVLVEFAVRTKMSVGI